MAPASTHRLGRLAALTSAVFIVTACGGGGGDSGGTPIGGTPPPPAVTPTPPAEAPTQVSGTVLLPIAAPGAPAPAPATVCYDTNLNGSCDTGEPTTTSDSQGAYMLSPLPSPRPADAALVAQIPGTVAPYKVQAPASKPELLSTFTTLVQLGVSQGMTLADSELAVSRQVQATVPTLYANYRLLPEGAERAWLSTFATEIALHLQAGTPMRVGPVATPTAGYDVTSFSFSGAGNHGINYNYSTQVPDPATGLVPYFALSRVYWEGFRISSNQPSVSTWWLLPQGWTQLFPLASRHELAGGNPTAVLTANGGRSIISTREFDVGGRAIRDVVADVRAVGGTYGNTFSSITLGANVDASAIGGTMPTGARVKVTRSATLSQAASYRLSDRTPGAHTTIAAMLAASPPLADASALNDSNNGLLVRGAIVLGPGSRQCTTGQFVGTPDNTVCTDSDVRVTFNGATSVATFYLCDTAFGPPMQSVNCRSIGTSAYTVGTMNDQATPSLNFATVPNTAATASLQAPRVVAQRPDGLYKVLLASRTISQVSLQASSRLNRTAFNALATSLGVPALNPTFTTPSTSMGAWRMTLSPRSGSVATVCEAVVVEPSGDFGGLCTTPDGSLDNLVGSANSAGQASFNLLNQSRQFTGQFQATTAAGTWQEPGSTLQGTWTATRF